MSQLEKARLYSYFPQEMKQMKNIDEVEAFLLKHGENIVDLLGAEIDRIESRLKVRHQSFF